jgi:hypothetical protein
VKFFLSSNLPTYHSSPPSLENSYKILILFSFLSPTQKLILPPLLKKLVTTNTLKIELKLFFGEKKNLLQDPSPSFKEKVKLLCLVANGRRRRRFLAWWSMEDPMLGGQWNVPCLVAIGM